MKDFNKKRTFKLIVEYDGGRYHGWQRQKNAISVQQTLEEAMERLTRHPVRCDGAGRTDAGVNAAGQVVRFVTSMEKIDGMGVMRAANIFLPKDIRVVSAEECRADFDPRRDARMRAYRYSFLTRGAASALERNRLAHVPYDLDWEAVERTLALLEGEHDFSAFRSSQCRATRTRLDLRVARHVDEHPRHHFDFECRSFLHNMVRLMSGLALDVGIGRLAPEIVEEFFATGKRAAQFKCADPRGLVLTRVEYDD